IGKLFTLTGGKVNHSVHTQLSVLLPVTVAAVPACKTWPLDHPSIPTQKPTVCPPCGSLGMAVTFGINHSPYTVFTGSGGLKFKVETSTTAPAHPLGLKSAMSVFLLSTALLRFAITWSMVISALMNLGFEAKAASQIARRRGSRTASGRRGIPYLRSNRYSATLGSKSSGGAP